MNKILFPFYKKYPGLKRFWWHRFFIVVFFFSLIFTPIYLYTQEISFAQQRLESCITSIGFIKDFQNRIKAEQDLCFNSELYKIHKGEILLPIIIVVIIAAYLIQIVYYKIFLYIIYGNKLKDLTSSI